MRYSKSNRLLESAKRRRARRKILDMTEAAFGGQRAWPGVRKAILDHFGELDRGDRQPELHEEEAEGLGNYVLNEHDANWGDCEVSG